MGKFRGFPKKLISSLVCQSDSQALIIKDEFDDNYVLNGNLVCPSCRREYEIKDGIVNLLEGQGELDSILKSEISVRNDQAAKYDERLAGRYYKEVLPTIKSLGDLSGKRIVEYGCGTGRLTLEVEKNCREIIAVDFSLKSLSQLSAKLEIGNVGLVLADATQIKTKKNYFDIALATQFFEHIPAEEQRKIFLNHAKETLVVNGKIVCSIYHYDWRRSLKHLPEEGYHDNKIYFRYYKKGEIKNLFKSYFKRTRIGFIDITLPLEARLRLPAKVGGAVSLISQSIYPLNRFAHLLLIRGVK